MKKPCESLFRTGVRGLYRQLCGKGLAITILSEFSCWQACKGGNFSGSNNIISRRKHRSCLPYRMTSHDNDINTTTFFNFIINAIPREKYEFTALCKIATEVKERNNHENQYSEISIVAMENML